MQKKKQAKQLGNIRAVLIWVLILNWAVAAAKIIYGFLTHFTSMEADGFHSLSDGASNIIGLIGVTFAYRPADKDHPYGHKKYETLFALGIAGLLFFVCFNLLLESWKKFHYPVAPEINLTSLMVMVVTIIINLLVMSYEYRAGKQLNSDILVSDSLHTRADIFTSLSVIAAMVVIKLGYPILDPVVTALIACFIAYAAFEIIKHSSSVLCDTVIIDGKRISDIALDVKGVRACHKIRTRGREDDIYVDMHVQVNPEMHVDAAHEISFKIEDAIKKKIPGVSDVVVHIEPKKK